MSFHRDILLLLRFFLRDLQAATEGEGERESSRGSSKEEDSGSKVDLRLGTLRCSSARKLDSFAGRVARLPANLGNRRWSTRKPQRSGAIHGMVTLSAFGELFFFGYSFPELVLSDQFF